MTFHLRSLGTTVLSQSVQTHANNIAGK
jgi:hypothetical protein